MKVTLNNKDYIFEKNYQDNDKLRHAHDALSQAVFGLSFEKWYTMGFWSASCRPYTLFDGEKAVSSLIVCEIDIVYDGELKHYIQLSTVMTDKEYGNKGLSRFLIESLFDDFEETTDCFFLFANDSVLDFYPKFGFIKETEYDYSAKITPTPGKTRQLSIDNPTDIKLILQSVTKGNPFSALRVLGSFAMFHCIMFHSDNLYYLEDYSLIAVLSNKDGLLNCYDIFGECDSNLKDVLSAMADSKSNKAVLGFTPLNKSEFETTISIEEDTTLFVSDKKDNLFSKNKLKFPLLSRA